MEIRFDFGDEHGRVLVQVGPNTDPVAVGKSERELGMPLCSASVEFSAQGYRPLLGWVQLVREPSTADRFEIDPFDLFADSSAPFAWYGFRPVLFDAPSRWRAGAVQWQAHSFLTIGPWDVDGDSSSLWSGSLGATTRIRGTGCTCRRCGCLVPLTGTVIALTWPRSARLGRRRKPSR